MWKKLQFLTFVHFETQRFIKNKSAPLEQTLEKGIDYLWIKALFGFHRTTFSIVARHWLGRANEAGMDKAKELIMDSNLDLLLDEATPKYIIQTEEGIHKYIKLTLEGQRFIRPLGFFTAVLKEYGIWASFFFGFVAAVLGVLGLFGIKEL